MGESTEMDTLAREDVQALLETSGPCASIYLPTHRIPAREDGIRFRKLVKAAKEELQRLGVNRRKAAEIIEPAHELMAGSGFREPLGDGLAVFLAPNFFRYFRLPKTFGELALASNRFHITPLVPLLEDIQEFFILAISQNRVRVLKVMGADVAEVKVDGMPEDMADALQAEEPEPMLQSHGGVQHGKAGRSTVIHGDGGQPDHKKGNLAEYFQRVDNALRRALLNEKAPLMFAGVDYLFPLYRAVSHCAHLLDQHVGGNPDMLSLDQLRDKAKALLAVPLQKRRDSELQRCLGCRPDPCASYDLKEIVLAAHRGQISSLFVAAGIIQWGQVDLERGEVHLSVDQSPATEELINAAAVETLRHGGRVHAVELTELPHQSPAAAVFRYPIPRVTSSPMYRRDELAPHP